MESTYLTVHTKEPSKVTLSSTNIIECLFLMIRISSILSFLSSADLVTRFFTTLVYKSQQDAQVTEFILSDNCSTCFGRHYHPPSGVQNNSNYRIW